MVCACVHACVYMCNFKKGSDTHKSFMSMKTLKKNYTMGNITLKLLGNRLQSCKLYWTSTLQWLQWCTFSLKTPYNSLHTGYPAPGIYIKDICHNKHWYTICFISAVTYFQIDKIIQLCCSPFNVIFSKLQVTSRPHTITCIASSSCESIHTSTSVWANTPTTIQAWFSTHR